MGYAGTLRALLETVVTMHGDEHGEIGHVDDQFIFLSAMAHPVVSRDLHVDAKSELFQVTQVPESLQWLKQCATS